MSDFGDFSGGSSGRAVGSGIRPQEPGRTPGVADRPTGGRAASGRGGKAGGGRDPLDLETAFARLKTLLAFDGPNGPREGVQRRGFYLNILT